MRIRFYERGFGRRSEKRFFKNFDFEREREREIDQPLRLSEQSSQSIVEDRERDDRGRRGRRGRRYRRKV